MSGAPRTSLTIGTVAGEAFNRPAPYARWIIDQSRRAIDAVTGDSPLHDWIETSRNIKLIGQAITRYADQHAGTLPPDLGATFPYTPDVLEFAKPIARVRLYLSPKSRDAADLPCHLDPSAIPAWLNEHASLGYLAPVGLTLVVARNSGCWILLHTASTDSYRVLSPDGDHDLEMAAFYSPQGVASLGPRPWIDQQIAQSRQALADAAKPPPALKP